MLIRRYEMPWRTAYEGYASAAWAAGATFFGYTSAVAAGPRELFIPLSLVCLSFCAWRLNAALRILRLRASLAGKSMSAIDSRRLRKLCKDPERVFLGFGFDWEPKHSQRLYELSKVHVPDFVVSRLLQRLFGYASQAQPATEVGAPFIHGVEPHEHAIYCPLENLQGGTCIVGTTQSGKGVCMTLLAAQAIYRGDVVIILDPKNSSRLKGNVIAACRDAGREPPLDFHPAFPERGIRLDPLFNWQKGTELASRIQSIMPPNTDGAFGAFAWNAVNVVVQGLLEIEDRPNLRKITHYVRSGIEGVLQPLLEKFFQAEAPANWREQARRYAREAREEILRAVSTGTGRQIRVLYGDVTSRGTLDEPEIGNVRRAVVSPEDTTISAGGGVALTLLTKAGPRFVLNELAKLGPIPHGTCAVTSAGDLPVHYIMHAAALHIQRDGRYDISPERVHEAIDSVLTIAEALGVGALWIPLLGAGVADLPAEASFRSIVSAFAKHSPSPACPLVNVVIFRESMLPRDEVKGTIEDLLPGFQIFTA